jgi:hypothetical protein
MQITTTCTLHNIFDKQPNNSFIVRLERINDVELFPFKLHKDILPYKLICGHVKEKIMYWYKPDDNIANLITDTIIDEKCINAWCWCVIKTN